VFSYSFGNDRLDDILAGSYLLQQKWRSIQSELELIYLRSVESVNEVRYRDNMEWKAIAAAVQQAFGDGGPLTSFNFDKLLKGSNRLFPQGRPPTGIKDLADLQDFFERCSLSRAGVGWDKDFQDGTELMTKLKTEDWVWVWTTGLQSKSRVYSNWRMNLLWIVKGDYNETGIETWARCIYLTADRGAPALDRFWKVIRSSARRAARGLQMIDRLMSDGWHIWWQLIAGCSASRVIRRRIDQVMTGYQVMLHADWSHSWHLMNVTNEPFEVFIRVQREVSRQQTAI
jgi:hypothetical protein